MNKREVIGIAIVIIVIAVLAFLAGLHTNKEEKVIENKIIENGTIIKAQVINSTKEMVKEIEDIAIKVSQEEEYQLKSYDCTNFSEELVKRLKTKGYNAYCRFGELRANGLINKHTWVEINATDKGMGIIEIESTRGYLLSQEQYDAEYFYYPRRYNDGECW